MDWIPAISTTTLFAGVMWLARNLIITRLTKSVQHEYDAKITNLKNDFTREHEHLKAKLRAKELLLESLKTTALNGISQRQIALFDKQVQAIEILWSQVIDLLPAKNAAQNLSVIKFEETLKAAADDPRLKEVFEMIGSNVNLTIIDTKEANKVRPFISPITWAYFSAYTAILGNAVLKFHMLKKGLNYPDFIDNDNLKTVIITALPHQKEYLEKVDSEAYYYLLDELESFMLLAFSNTLSGEHEDKQTLSKAAEIIRASEELTNKDEANKKSMGSD